MNKKLFKHSFYSLLIDPLFYACSAVTVLYTCFTFFFVNHFFLVEKASSSLLVFFNSIAHISILTIPLIVYRLSAFIKNDSIPVKSIIKYITLNLCAFCASLVPVLLLTTVPILVSFYGRVDAGQCAAGFAGMILYLFCACTFVVFLFSAVKSSRTFSLLLSILILFIFNFIHLIPLYVKTGDFTSFLLQKISFAWHFDASSKGIVDTRDFAFYIFVSAAFILLSLLFEYKRTGLRFNKTTAVLCTATVLFSFGAFSRIYLRFDLTADKQYSVSALSRQLCKNLDNPLRITYFQSKELKQFYPQTSEVVEYLKAFAASSPQVTLSLEKADPAKLGRLGIQGRQLKTENSTKLEYNYVYSAILLQYLDKSTLIPFVISTKTLEYDITQRIQQLLAGNERKVYIVAGNGMNIDEDYSYLEPWLNSRGFMSEKLSLNQLSTVLDHISTDSTLKTQLVVLGSSKLSMEHCAAIKNACEKGISCLFFTSPYTADIKNDWNVTLNKNDNLIPVLNSWGFAFDYSLAEDLSCFPLTMTTGEGVSTEYQTVNYPLWISILPQNEAYEGVNVSWASPVVCYLKAQPLLQTSSFGWKQKPSQDPKNPFLINPFIIPKTASASDARNEILTVAAEIIDEKQQLKTALIADQYFLSSLMTGFTSTTESGDFRNYDYAATILLKLRGEEKLADLMHKSVTNNSLYKISSQEQLLSLRKITVIISFIILPLLILIFAAAVFIYRRVRK